MTTTESPKMDVTEDERRRYVRTDDGKDNPKPLGKATWFWNASGSERRGREVR
jgi:hypothetical protein